MTAEPTEGVLPWHHEHYGHRWVTDAGQTFCFHCKVLIRHVSQQDPHPCSAKVSHENRLIRIADVSAITDQPTNNESSGCLE